MAGTGNVAGNRRRKARANGSSLDASWITGSADAVSSELEPTTANASRPSSLNSANLAQHQQALNEQQSQRSERGHDASGSPDIQPLGAPSGLQPYPGGLNSSVPSRPSGSPRLSTADNQTPDKSQGPSSARDCVVTPPKAKKKRYASQHHADWLEDAAETMQPQSDEADHELVRPNSQPSLSMADPGSQRVMILASTQTPNSNSPSIFRLPHSPHGGIHGYDAPPVVPMVRPNYSPHRSL